MNQIFLNEDSIIEIIVVGNQTDLSVREMGEHIAVLIAHLQRTGRPVLILDNLKNLGQTTSPARKEVAYLARTLAFDRAAMVGDGSPMMRYGTNLMLQAIGRPNLRYFASRDAALVWLLMARDTPTSPAPTNLDIPKRNR